MSELEFEFSLRPGSDPELAPYVVEFIGKTLAWDDREGSEKRVGEIRGYKLDLAAADVDGLDQASLLDSICPEISDFSQTAFGDAGCHYLQEMADGNQTRRACSGLVYINEIKVDSNYRGQGIGTALLGKIGQMVGIENSLIALKAFPLSEEYGKRVPDIEVQRVKHFYERQGFTHIGGEYMVKQANLCDAVKKHQTWRKGQEQSAVIDQQGKRQH
ncbi:MAG: GNAT family N-acetyltransferase [Sedimenticola sp.]|nr:GNAT family N-acetyltransferase [Sedimenticola sp.]